MIRHLDLLCHDDTRRQAIIQSETLQGIEYLEVVTAPEIDNQRVLQLFFLPKANPAHLPKLIQLLDSIAGHFGAWVRIEGGARIQDVSITSATRQGDHLRLRVNHPGDFANYRLTIERPPPPAEPNPAPGDPILDPAYTMVEFNFKVACPSQFDCRPVLDCPAELEVPPFIDYLAKDYASFRQVLLDRISQIHPQWTERNPADLGLALVELLAHAGDHLSYYQDAVANEAYLETARQRISGRRHAKLIDYRMHDGTSARLFVCLTIRAGSQPIMLPKGAQLLARISEPLQGGTLPGRVIPVAQKDAALRATAAIYETQHDAGLHPELSLIPIHAWERSNCCLPRGSTTADLQGELSPVLEPGNFLLLEEVRSPETGQEADADPTHRQVVRIVEVTSAFDPVAQQVLTRVRWDPADALRFPLCITAPVTNKPISGACGNVVLADHGRTLTEWHPEPPGQGPGIEPGPRPYRFRLQDGPLSYRLMSGASDPVAAMLTADPRMAKAEITELSVQDRVNTEKDWIPQPDLLSSDPHDTHVVVETDNFGRPYLRFGDDVAGKAPPKGAAISVTYRIGVGSSGMLPAGAIGHLVAYSGLNETAILQIRNPLPAWGGIDPEPLEVVKLTAPAALRQGLYRAVTEDDYARIAETSPDVAKAVATFHWTGFWHTVALTIDPRGGAVLTPAQEVRILDLVARYTQTGYDLRLEKPIYVPLEAVINVCVHPDHFRADVAEDLALELSNRVRPGGRLGFFHPDRFTFGQTLYVSHLVSAVMAVEGVLSTRVTRLQRFGALAAGEVERGSITAGRREILRLDNDPNFPENGVLRFDVTGGK